MTASQEQITKPLALKWVLVLEATDDRELLPKVNVQYVLHACVHSREILNVKFQPDFWSIVRSDLYQRNIEYLSLRKTPSKPHNVIPQGQ